MGLILVKELAEHYWVVGDAQRSIYIKSRQGQYLSRDLKCTISLFGMKIFLNFHYKKM